MFHLLAQETALASTVSLPAPTLPHLQRTWTLKTAGLVFGKWSKPPVNLPGLMGSLVGGVVAGLGGERCTLQGPGHAARQARRLRSSWLTS